MKRGPMLMMWLAACASAPLSTKPPIPPPASAEFVAAPGDLRLYSAISGKAQHGLVWFVLGAEIASAPLYPKLTKALHRAGYATAVLHPRGTGYSEGPRGDLRNYSLLLDDLRRYQRWLSRRFPERVFLFGHSAGAALALELAADAPDLAGVVLINPAWKLVYGEGMGPTFVDYLSYSLNLVFRPAALTVDMNPNPAAIVFAADRAEAQAMQQDPLVVRYFSLRYLLAQAQVMDRCPINAKRVSAPVLLIEGHHDALVDPAGTALLFGSMRGPDKTKLVAREGGHGSSAVETMVTPIVEWLNEHRKYRKESRR